MFEPVSIYVKASNLCHYFAMIPKDISRDSPKHMLMWHHSVTNPLKDKLLKTHFPKWKSPSEGENTEWVKWKQFFSFWNVNAQRFAEYLWRNHVIKNQVSLCSHHWYGVHNLKWNIFLPLAISLPFSLLPKWRAGFVWKGHTAFMELALTCWQANVITFL